MSDEDLAELIQLLKSMEPKDKAPLDGRGVYLGTGIPNKFKVQLRSNDLVELLQELQVRRDDRN